MTRTDPVVRFWKYTKVMSGCWKWLSAKNTFGYGRLFVSKSRAIQAHRFSWELHFGKIPDGLFVLHKCDNRECVNPSHLFLGTAMDNTQDMIRKGRVLVGERHQNSKATNEIVKIIRSAKATGQTHWGRKMIAKRFGLSIKQTSDIANRRRWSHV